MVKFTIMAACGGLSTIVLPVIERQLVRNDYYIEKTDLNI